VTKGGADGFGNRHGGGVIAGQVVPQLPHPRQQRSGGNKVEGRFGQCREHVTGSSVIQVSTQPAGAHGGEDLDHQVLGRYPVRVLGQQRSAPDTDRSVVRELVRQRRCIDHDHGGGDHAGSSAS